MSIEDKQRHILLSWKLLEYKLMYYKPELINEIYYDKLTISDYEYDSMEREYLDLCIKLGLENTVAHNIYNKNINVADMEIDITRHSVQLILSKYGTNNINLIKENSDYVWDGGLF